MMTKTGTKTVWALLLVLLFAANVQAHCEIPCGIYDDEMRIKMINEHIDTIEKSMKQITELATEPGHHANQLTRWVMNKEHHADELQEIVSQYFMTQRIKPDQGDYEKKLVLLHQMLVTAMKCKQTTDVENCDNLRKLTVDFAKLYFKK